jgi:hypothetical protein
MRDLEQALRDFVLLFDGMAIPYVVMGGIAVRIYGIPRPTQDIDITLALDRNRLSDLYEALRALGYTVPEAYASGWVDTVAGMPLVKVRRYLEGTGGRYRSLPVGIPLPGAIACPSPS